MCQDNGSSDDIVLTTHYVPSHAFMHLDRTRKATDLRNQPHKRGHMLGSVTQHQFWRFMELEAIEVIPGAQPSEAALT